MVVARGAVRRVHGRLHLRVLLLLLLRAGRKHDRFAFMQTSFSSAYMWTICYGFFLMLGNVGFRASMTMLFVMHIYKAIKCE